MGTITLPIFPRTDDILAENQTEVKGLSFQETFPLEHFFCYAPGGSVGNPPLVPCPAPGRLLAAAPPDTRPRRQILLQIPDPVHRAAAALLDRLLHHATVIQIEGASCPSQSSCGSDSRTGRHAPAGEAKARTTAQPAAGTAVMALSAAARRGSGQRNPKCAPGKPHRGCQ